MSHSGAKPSRPSVGHPARRKYSRKGIGSGSLEVIAQLAGWPTPDASACNLTDTTWQERRERIKAKQINGNGFGLTLAMASQLAGWAMPSARDWKNGQASDETMNRNARPLTRWRCSWRGGQRLWRTTKQVGLGAPSAQMHSDSTGTRSSLARIVSADWVQTNGLGLALCSAR